MAILVILRHGESTWNRRNLFTGWHDVPLSEVGREEAVGAGVTLLEAGLWFDVLHTSVLRPPTWPWPRSASPGSRCGAHGG